MSAKLVFSKLSKSVWRSKFSRNLQSCPRKLNIILKMDFTTATNVAGLSFGDITFDNLVLRSLPVEENRECYPRTVSGACFSRIPLSPLENPEMVSWSPGVAQLLDLSAEEMQKKEAAEYLSGSKLIPGTEPSAHCYCGHQFGYFAGQLGDGAAMYLGEVINSRNERWEIQLKGAGITPYSRTADGRKVLRSSIREFLCSETMHYLGIPTTRALSCVTSDSRIDRDIFYDGHPIKERCTVVCRVSPTFIRFGSFEIFKTLDPLTGRVGPSYGRVDILNKMLDYVISTFYKEIYDAHSSDAILMYTEFYREVVKRTAHLVASWQCVGFCHGVLNTDNMSILGVTIDYGPFGFMENFNPDFICNASDDGGRYSYINQPKMCEWNLYKLAEALKSVLPLEISKEVLNATFTDEFNERYLSIMRKKLGLLNNPLPNDKDLITDFLKTLQETGSDFTNSFRILSEIPLPEVPGSDFQKPFEEVSNKLIDYGCSAEDFKDMHRPQMADSHFRMYVQILSQHPEVLEQLGKGADALKREIERREKFEQIESLTNESKTSQDKEKWTDWLNKYVDRLKLEVGEGDDVKEINLKRIETMNTINPRFILRNYIAQVAIEKAENGDFSEVNNLLKIFEKPYVDEPSNVKKPHLSTTMESLAIDKDKSESGGSCHAIKSYDETAPSWARSLRVT